MITFPIFLLVLGFFLIFLGFYLIKKIKAQSGEYIWVGEENEF